MKKINKILILLLRLRFIQLSINNTVYRKIIHITIILDNLAWKIFPGNSIDIVILKKLESDSIKIFKDFLDAKPEKKDATYAEYLSAKSKLYSHIDSC